ncbi:MAG: DNA-3-methyladenine glycosylase family protein [Microthrixaceae bacterium]
MARPSRPDAHSAELSRGSADLPRGSADLPKGSVELPKGSVELSYEGEIDWRSTVAWFAKRAIAGVEATPTGSDGMPRYLRTVAIGGEPAVIELSESPGEGTITLSVDAPQPPDCDDVVTRVRSMIRLDTDQLSAVEHLSGDPVLAPLVEHAPGLRPPGCWSSFETTVRAVLGQQVSVTAATTVAARICAAHGRAVDGFESCRLSYLFPEPEALADADLNGLGLTTRRAATISTVARAVADGDLVPPGCSGDAGPELAMFLEGLAAIKGIGEWTTGYLALRAGSADAFPAGDLALREAWGRLTGSPRPSAAELTRIAEAWRPWRSFAAIHLWSSLDRVARQGAP